MAALLTGADATVTACHSKTRDLAGAVGPADVVVAAIGRAEMIKARRSSPARSSSTSARPAGGRQARGDVEFAAAAARASRDHARPRRRRPDDDRHAARQHREGRQNPRGVEIG